LLEGHLKYQFTRSELPVMKLLRFDQVRRRRRISGPVGFALATFFVAPVGRVIAAQIPGTPTLQNVWATPGLVAAVDVAGGSDGATYAGAVSWAPHSARFQLSGGGGMQSLTGRDSRGVYGVRAAIPFGGAASAIGFAVFGGIGGGSGGSTTSADSVSSTTEIPLGASIGWRHALGSNHGISLYGAPSYVLFSGGSKSDGLFRASIGADAGITTALGATLGVDFGATRARGLGGPSGILYALGISYAFGHR
jgi:hypothetical protein